MQQHPRKVRCNECAHRINLLGNSVNIMCGVTNHAEPLNEPLYCEDFEAPKKPIIIKKKMK